MTKYFNSHLGVRIAFAIFAPLILLTIMTLYLQDSLHKAEIDAEKFEIEENIYRASSNLNRDIFLAWNDLSASTTEVSIKKAAYYKAFTKSCERLETDLSRLVELRSNYLSQFGERETELRKIIESYKDARKILAFIKAQIETSAMDEEAYDRTPAAKKLRYHFSLMSEGAAAISNYRAVFQSETSFESAKNFRTTAKRWSEITVLLNILLAAVLFVFVYKNLTRRISLLKNNVDNLLLGHKLEGKVSGTDEIAHLDMKFRKMAEEVNRANELEKAVLETAPDPILTVSRDLRVTKANPAALNFFNITEYQSEGSRLSNLFKSANFEEISTLLSEANKEEIAKTCDIELSKETKHWINLSVQFSQSHGLYTFIIRDITSRVRAEKLRDQAIAMISHDLRSPLTTVGVACEILENSNGGTLNELGKSAVRQASQSSKQMLALTNDLLDLEKASTGLMVLDLSRVIFGDLCESAIQAVSGQISQRKQTVNIQGTNNALVCDFSKMLRVLCNLIGNAANYSPENSAITIAAEARPDSFRIVVKDQGPGVPDREKVEIFEPYFQSTGKTSRALKTNSTGLGLAICKSFVELHGGSIWIEDLPAGGSAFICKWPK